MDSPITNLIERGLTSVWRVLKVSYIEKNILYRLHFGYKSCVSFTNVAFRVQKLRFAYKYLVFNLQNCILKYKVASRLAIQPCNSAQGLFVDLICIKYFPKDKNKKHMLNIVDICKILCIIQL